MRVIHSFWSKAYFHGRWGIGPTLSKDLYCFALSAVLVQKYRGHIELVTDDYGASLLEGIPYDRVHRELNDIEHVDPRFWTAGKVYALSTRKKPTVHIDGDVFFLDDRCVYRLEDKWDVMVQMKEMGGHYESTYPPIFDELDKYIKREDFRKYNFAYNTGIFGIQNLDFFRKFSFEYFNNIYELEILEAKINSKHDINVALEQSLLTTMSQDNNLYVKEMINGREMSDPGLFETADEIGFCHLWGSTKYEDKWQGRIKRRLKEEAPGLFELIQERVGSFLLSEDFLYS